MNSKLRIPELLAPAGDMEKLQMAVRYGADAVYLAGTSFGMRSFAGNFSPEELPGAIRLARRCMRIVYENIVFALAVMIAFLILSAFGLIGMWLAIFADVGVMVIAVLNATRALRTKGVR